MDEFIKNIKTSSLYRGQIYKSEIINKDEIANSQKQEIELSKKNIFKTFKNPIKIIPELIYYAMREAQQCEYPIMIIVVNDEYKSKLLKLIQNENEISRDLSVKDGKEIYADIIIETYDRLLSLFKDDFAYYKDLIILIGRIYTFSFDYNIELMSSINLIMNIFDSIEYASNQYGIFFLGSEIASVQYLISKIRNTAKEENTAIYSDHIEIENNYNLNYWLCPFIYDPERQFNGNPIYRNNYYDEMNLILKHLNNYSEGSNILLWNSFLSIPKDKMKTIFEFNNKKNIEIINNIWDASINKKYDHIVLLGLPRNAKYLKFILSSLIENNGYVWILFIDEPYSNYMLKSNEDFIDLPTPECIIMQHRMSKIGVSLEDIIRNQNLFSIYKEKHDKLCKIWGEKAIENIFKYNDEMEYYEYINNYEVLEDHDVKYIVKTADDKHIKIINLDKYYPEKIYIGSVINIDGKYYETKEIDENKKYIIVNDIVTTQNAITYPKIEDQMIKENKNDKFKEEIINNIKYRIFTGEYSGKLTGAYMTSSLSYNEQNSTMIINPEEFKKKIKTIEISTDTLNIDAFYDIFLNWLPIYIINYIDIINLIKIDNKIYIYIDEKDEIVDDDVISKTYQIIRTYMIDIFEKALDNMVFYCDCEKGCRNCLINHKTAIIGTNKSDKISLIESLSKYTNHDYSQELKFINGKLNSKQPYALKRSEELKQKVIEVMEKKLEMIIKNETPMELKNQHELNDICGAKAAACYKGAKVFMGYPYPRALLIQIIAHEYGHAWQFDEGSNFSRKLLNTKYFKGKLFVEGNAEWISFKIMDMLNMMNGIENLAETRDDYSIDGGTSDEYSYGFQLFYWIETEFGIQALIDFTTKGQFEYEGTIYGPDEVIDKSNSRPVLDKIHEQQQCCSCEDNE